jgi:hypothetical protein
LGPQITFGETVREARNDLCRAKIESGSPDDDFRGSGAWSRPFERSDAVEERGVGDEHGSRIVSSWTVVIQESHRRDSKN